MGFGHRVYKNYDPRAKILKDALDKLLGVMKISDPLPKFRGRLMDAGILSQQHDRELDEQIVDEVNHAHLTAEAAPYPNVDWAAGPVFAP